MPFAPCECADDPSSTTPSDTSTDYGVAFAASLSLVERHVLESLRLAKPGSRDHLNAAGMLLKVAEFRHGVHQKHSEALAINRIEAALEEITTHLAGHAGSNRLAEDSDPQAGEVAGQ